MKLRISVLLICLILIASGLMGCAAPVSDPYPQPSETEEAQPSLPTQPPAPTEAPPTLPGEDMLGEWQDSWSQRASMTVTREGQGFSVVIRWADSAFESNEWRMSGVYEDVEDGRILSGDCALYHVIYDEEGSVTQELVYENGSAHITYVNGMLYWLDKQENAGDECMFERVE